MKTRTWILITMAFFIVATGFATDYPKINVVPVEKDKAMVAYQSSESSPLEITLTDNDGDILYFKKTKKSYYEYRKTFDFSMLRDGEYNVCVNFGNRSISRSIHVKNESITVGVSQRLFEPCFSMKEGMLDVSFFNCAQKQVYLNIYKDGEYVNSVKFRKGVSYSEAIGSE
uniref:hypothetical protein n=1 Tax=uncultured Draconibacterium sp. TaxID=1573823 RepID=UPI003217AC91